MVTRDLLLPSTKRGWRPLGLLLLAGALTLSAPAGVSATTGPTTPTPARYTVPLPLAQPFRGQYSLVSAAPRARIRNGAMAIDLNTLRYLYGVAQFEGYDARGHRTTWIAGLYNFDLVAHGRMRVTLYDRTDTAELGRMVVTQQANGDLVGQIFLDHATYAVRWHKNLNL